MRLLVSYDGVDNFLCMRSLRDLILKSLRFEVTACWDFCWRDREARFFSLGPLCTKTQFWYFTWLKKCFPIFVKISIDSSIYKLNPLWFKLFIIKSPNVNHVLPFIQLSNMCLLTPLAWFPLILLSSNEVVTTFSFYTCTRLKLIGIRTS